MGNVKAADSSFTLTYTIPPVTQYLSSDIECLQYDLEVVVHEADSAAEEVEEEHELEVPSLRSRASSRMASGIATAVRGCRRSISK